MITSSQNAKLKSVRKLLSQRKYRESTEQFVMENTRHIMDALKANLGDFVFIVYSNLPKSLDSETLPCPSFQVEPDLLNAITTLNSGCTMLAVLNKPQWSYETVVTHLSIGAVLDSVSNPQNVGAIIRNAAAFELDAVFVLPSSADPYHPESLRAMAGCYYQVPIFFIEPETLIELGQSGVNFYTLDPHAATPLSAASFSARSVFVFGEEGHGVGSALRERLNPFQNEIKIEMSSKVESLNVAVSSGIVFQMYKNH